MNFIKISGIALAGLLLILVFLYLADVSQLRVDVLRIHNAEEKLELINQRPYDNPLFQAGMTTDAKLVLETAKRDQRIDKMGTWFHLILLIAGAALLGYKWVKR